MSVEAGSRAPDFAAPANGGKTISLRDYKGKKLVLFFYPKDDTPGCTQEACEFRDSMERISAAGAVVLGLSPDAPKSHDKFINKFDLNFSLLSDEDQTICKAYGVWVEKKMFGRTFMGVERSTFIIDEQGIISHAMRKVRVPGHVDNVIALLHS